MSLGKTLDKSAFTWTPWRSNSPLFLIFIKILVLNELSGNFVGSSALSVNKICGFKTFKNAVSFANFETLDTSFASVTLSTEYLVSSFLGANLTLSPFLKLLIVSILLSKLFLIITVYGPTPSVNVNFIWTESACNKVGYTKFIATWGK